MNDPPILTPVRINLPVPLIGGKAWLLEKKGTYILEEGPGVCITIACTHAGSGSMMFRDGVPNDAGFFPEFEEASEADKIAAPGRIFYRANPIVMGSWMLNAGFMNGLTVEYKGGHDSAPCYASIVWQAFKRRQQG